MTKANRGRAYWYADVDVKGHTLEQRLEAWREHKRTVKIHRKQSDNWERAVAARTYGKYGLSLGMLIVQLRHLQKKIQEKKRVHRQYR